MSTLNVVLDEDDPCQIPLPKSSSDDDDHDTSKRTTTNDNNNNNNNTLMESLGLLLELNDTEHQRLSTLLSRLGCTTLTDVSVLEGSDLTSNDEQNENETALTVSTTRKVLYLIQYLRVSGGGTLLEGNTTMETIISTVHAATRQSSTTTRQTRTNHSSPFCPSSDRVHLNVGGCQFVTTRKTLTSQKGSLLEAMFSGRHPTHLDPDDTNVYHIDRNGMYFGYVLDYLRCGTVVRLPDTQAAKDELLVEADYYGLDNLMAALQQSHRYVDIQSLLPEPVQQLRALESRLRRQWRQNSSTTQPHDGLLNLFDDNDVTHPIVYEPLDNEGKRYTLLMPVRENPPGTAGTPVCVQRLSYFEYEFNQANQNVLHRLRPVLRSEPVVVAGGSVLRALTSKPSVRTSKWWDVGHTQSDVDIFVCTRDANEATRIARRIFYSLAVDGERWVVVRGRGVINMHRWSGPVHRWNNWIMQKVQIVLRLYESPAEVLLGFDCDCCCCAYDGTTIWVTQRWLYSLRKGVNFLNSLHAWPNKASYELRLAKYAYRGFPVVAVGLDPSRIKHSVRTRKLDDLKGMARLLRVSYDMETPPPKDWIVHPRPPDRVEYLREPLRNDFNPVEQLLRGVGGYDDEIENVLIPSVYENNDFGEFLPMMWFEHVGGQFGTALNTRDSAWNEIENGPPNTEDDENVFGFPNRLVDAWETEKRSREYLNSDIDVFDRDNIYYGHVYDSGDEE